MRVCVFYFENIGIKLQLFLCVFQTLPDSAVSNYAASIKDKSALVPALYKVIRENYSDVRTHTLIF